MGLSPAKAEACGKCTAMILAAMIRLRADPPDTTLPVHQVPCSFTQR